MRGSIIGKEIPMNAINRRAFVVWFVFSPAFLVHSGVTNPDVSALGQVLFSVPSGPHAHGAQSWNLALGETELVLDAPLNPYSKGIFTFAIGKEGFEIEEAYATIFQGLPLNLSMRTGKFRCPFGKWNAVHPHAYPFIQVPHVLNPEASGLLPGGESFNDVGIELSSLIGIGENWTTLITGDVLQGNSFHPDTSAQNPAWLIHVSNFFQVREKWACEIGGSLSRGTVDPAVGTLAEIAGVDFKTQYTSSTGRKWIVSGEWIRRRLDGSGPAARLSMDGFFIFSDYQFSIRQNAGVIYEQYPDAADPSGVRRSLKPFYGFRLLEESTVVRSSYEWEWIRAGETNRTAEIQFLFSMGPHKPHTF
jgi:hypothetical protein